MSRTYCGTFGHAPIDQERTYKLHPVRIVFEIPDNAFRYFWRICTQSIRFSELYPLAQDQCWILAVPGISERTQANPDYAQYGDSDQYVACVHVVAAVS